MATRHYAHLETAIIAHFWLSKATIVVEPVGRGRPDIEGVDGAGKKIIGEIKSAAECTGSPSSWWSYWNKGERQLAAVYPDKAESIEPSARGWCAVLDGQLREYCEKEGVARGHLVVESFTRFATDVKSALSFLSKCNRIKVESTDIDANGIGYVAIMFS
jgi:hypothetical protein